MLRTLAIATLALAAGLGGCATYDGPPDVTIVGDQQGQLTDPRAPIVLSFSKPPKPETIKVEIARYVVDDEGNLPDEDADPGTELDLLFSHDPVDGDTGGTSALSDDKTTFTITLDVVPPAGQPLVLLVEKGLADEKGVVTTVRRRIVFTYASNLTCNAAANVVKTGTYFFIAQITKPIATQVKLYGVVQIDPATGKLKTRFSKAKRNPDPNRCTPACAATEACRLVPTQQCVTPSEPAGSVDEYSDYVFDADPTTGFNFAADGCSADESATTASFATADTDVKVSSPMVTLRNASLNGSFSLDSMGVLRAVGSLTADAVLLGTIDSGMGQGDLTGRAIPDAEVPPDLPQP
jgi:hypothetical protein